MQKKKILGLMTKSVGLSVSLQDPLGFVFVFPCCVQTQPCCWWMEAAEVKRPWELEAHSPWQTLEAFSPICTPRWIWIQDLIWTFFWTDYRGWRVLAAPFPATYFYSVLAFYCLPEQIQENYASQVKPFVYSSKWGIKNNGPSKAWK